MRLAEIRCVGAVPEMIEAIKRDPREKVVSNPGVTTVLFWGGKNGEGGMTSKAGNDRIALTPLAFALYMIGPEALFAVRKELEREEQIAEQGLRTQQIACIDGHHITEILYEILRAWEQGGIGVDAMQYGKQ